MKRRNFLSTSLIGLLGTSTLNLRASEKKAINGRFVLSTSPTCFYDSLHQRGQVIYQGKLSDTNCFRIGIIGQFYLEDIENLLNAIKEALEEMGIIVPILTAQ